MPVLSFSMPLFKLDTINNESDLAPPVASSLEVVEDGSESLESTSSTTSTKQASWNDDVTVVHVAVLVLGLVALVSLVAALVVQKQRMMNNAAVEEKSSAGLSTFDASLSSSNDDDLVPSEFSLHDEEI